MLLASIASVASILCLCCLWCTRSSAQQLARSRHSNTNVGFAVYTLDVHLGCTLYIPGCYWCKVCDLRRELGSKPSFFTSSTASFNFSMSPPFLHFSKSSTISWPQDYSCQSGTRMTGPNYMNYQPWSESLYTLPSSCRPPFLVCKFVLPPSAPHWLWASANWSMQTWFLCKM